MVALRKESVDRNMIEDVSYNIIVNVALRKESVDRNGLEINGVSYDVWSLSARRAWIEIVRGCLFCVRLQSLSARRAWIEINMWCSAGKPLAVALRKESVDRNS